MTANGWLQILLVLAVVLAITKPLGIFMARVFGPRENFSRYGAPSDRKARLPPDGRG